MNNDGPRLMTTARAFCAVLLVIPALAAMGCGSGESGCNEHHPYACEEQRAKEKADAESEYAKTLAPRVAAKKSRWEALTNEFESRYGDTPEEASKKAREAVETEVEVQSLGSQ
jgi:ABC-type phosphate transport system substrate-binding protein